ncbi:MAG: helical backbone metal receptor [Myxococcota bacterium]
MGRAVRLKGPRPQRIVSLVPSQTELLAELGLDDEVVGLTRYCIHPTDWKARKAIVGGTKKARMERVADLNPDLILASGLVEFPALPHRVVQFLGQRWLVQPLQHLLGHPQGPNPRPRIIEVQLPAFIGIAKYLPVTMALNTGHPSGVHHLTIGLNPCTDPRVVALQPGDGLLDPGVWRHDP